ncbi:MAG: flagellar basal body protein [Defluviitaleaceae bacterium]|nr:flagellar basal body protein [Defluviitaleaceae bacterium]MCL2263987.1 flagellar basal body protein [Defluviitaleaceae bacterium]
MGFGGLQIATSGLRAAQRNLNITGHNIANAEVTGYSRQRQVQVTSFNRDLGISGGGNRMQVGAGTDWSEVHQIRNEFLDINFRNNVSQLQFYSAKVEAGIAVQTLLGELHGAYNFQTAVNSIWFSIQELTAMPEGLATRQFFLSNANSFITKAQEVLQGMIDYQNNLDLQIRNMVNGPNGINATVSAIADMNHVIRFTEMSGERANDYRDQRNNLLDHLATMIPIDVWHGPNGDVNITSLGHHLLTGTNQSMMGLRFIANDSPFVEPVFTTETDILSAGTPPTEFTSYLNYIQAISPNNNNDRGRLIALMQARGNAPANHLSADVLPPMLPARINELATLVEAQIALLPADPDRSFEDSLAMAIASVNAQIHATPPPAPAALEALQALHADLVEAQLYVQRDRNLFIQRIISTPAGPFADDLQREIERDFQAQTHNHRAHMWSLENSMIPQVQMNLDRMVNSVVTMINDAITGYLRGDDGNFLFYQTDANGNPLLQYNIDGTPRIDPVTGEQMRVPHRPRDGNIPSREGIPLFVRESDLVFDNDLGRYVFTGSWPVAQDENPNRIETVFTTVNLRLNPEFLVEGGHNHLALSLSDAPGDTDLLVALQQVWMSAYSHYSVEVGGRTFNIQDAYMRITGMIATETAEASSKVTTQTIQVDQAQNMRMAIKGVSMDEEMSAMLRFQFAFQAASRVFNVIDSMIDTIVNGTGRVGR